MKSKKIFLIVLVILVVIVGFIILTKNTHTTQQPFRQQSPQGQMSQPPSGFPTGEPRPSSGLRPSGKPPQMHN